MLPCPNLYAESIYETWLSVKKTNFEIKSSIKELEISEIYGKEGVADFLPNVVLDTAYQRNIVSASGVEDGDTLFMANRISVEQKLIDMISYQNIATLNIQREIDSIGLLQKVESVRYQFLKTYLETARAEQLLLLFETTYELDLKRIEQTLESNDFIELRGAANIGFEVVRLESLKTRIVNLKSEFERSKTALFEITNAAPKKIDIDFMKIKSFSNFSNGNLRTDVSYKLLKLKRMKLGSMGKAERNMIFPTLTLFATKTWDYNYQNAVSPNRNNKDTLIGVRMSWPLTLGIRGNYRSEVERIKEGLAGIESNRWLSQRSQKVESLQNVYTSLEKSAGTSLNLYKRGESMLTIVRDKRDAGIISQADQLSLVISALELKSSAIETMANFSLFQVDQLYESLDLDEESIYRISDLFKR